MRVESGREVGVDGGQEGIAVGEPLGGLEGVHIGVGAAQQLEGLVALSFEAFDFFKQRICGIWFIPMCLVEWLN